MVNLKKISLMLIVAVLSVTFFSCKNTSKKTDSAVEDEVISDDVEEYVYPLISSFDITKMLNEIEASYIVGITFDPTAVEQNFTDQDKALALGVYSADLAYATTYNQKNEIQKYMKAVEYLLTELDMTAAVSRDVAQQIEANLDNNDALVDIITQVSQDTYSYLNKQGRTELSYLILAGSVFEGLYLTTHISENSFNNPKIVQTILYQKNPLMKLEEMLDKYKDSEMSRMVYNNIKKINAIYALEEGTTSMTEEQIEALIRLLEKIRE
ncbi:MAG: hypothetical protein PF436_11605 [Prolixibacteraceae bacterium]|jgi:hypothetical protein|nr:hypothetical protein [Prolixibacteraceae bacterium]